MAAPNYQLAILACVQQYVICNPSTSSCTQAGGWFQLEERVRLNTPGFNFAQLVAASRIVLALVSSQIHSIVDTLGAGALLANNLVLGVTSPGLPDDQWRVEVLGWFQTNLAKLQAYMVDFASNTVGLSPFTTPSSPFNTRTPELAAAYQPVQEQCANQLVQTAGEVQNFSFLGVMTIVCVSASLMALDWSLERIVDFLNRRRGWGSSTKRARQADSKLHLQRMALGAPVEDGGDWESGSWDVPILGRAERFDEPTVSKGLVSYTAPPTELVEAGGHVSGNRGVSSKQDSSVGST